MYRYWLHWHNVRYEMGKRVERLQMKVASKLPRWAKKWVFIEITNRHFVNSGKELGAITCVDALKEYYGD